MAGLPPAPFAAASSRRRTRWNLESDAVILAELALIFSVAVAISLVLVRMRLPAVLAYVGTGLLLGPAGFGLVEKHGLLDLIAEIGVILLLFTVGLEFSLQELKRSWRTVILAGGLQVAGTTTVAAVAAPFVGVSVPAGVTWGFLVSLSSTAVVLRLLDARGETKAAHGRLVVGILVFQDLCVVPMMLLLPILAGRGGGLASVAQALAQATGIVAGILVLARLVVPPLMRLVARTRNREVFLLAVLGIAGMTAYATSLTGLSLALGAFLAGMVLADTQYSHQALADVLPIRSVMMCVFFVAIGMLVDLEVVAAHPGSVGAMFGAIVAVKFGVAFVTGLALRFPVRLAALAAVALAQVGEFSFVLAGAAAKVGLVGPEDQRRFLAASVLTIAVAPLLVSLFPRLLAGTKALAPLERILDETAAPPVVDGGGQVARGHVIVAGLGVGGRAVLTALERAGVRTVVIELNPETVAAERQRGRTVVYGDVTSPEVLDHAGIGEARALVLAVSDLAASHRGVEVARELRPDVPIVLRTRFAVEEGMERRPGVDVLSEEFAGAMAIAGLALRRCGVEDWGDMVEKLVEEHEDLPEGDEGRLGAPPTHAVRAIVAAPDTHPPTGRLLDPPEER